MASSTSESVRRPFRAALLGLLYLTLLSAVAFGVAVAVAVASLPSYQDLTKRTDLGQMVRVRASNGAVLISMGPSFGQWLTYDQIPPTMRAAMVSVEDRRFREHFGVDVIGLVRALGSAVLEGHRVRATSTLTQQLARNTFLTNNRSMARKLKEAVLAVALERKFTKDQILELYLNRMYFGGGSYGIDAASRRFFGHGADHLSLGEAAIVAGLVKAPSSYSPTADMDAARDRAKVVLKTMVENGFVPADKANEVDFSKIALQQQTTQNNVRYFTDWALPQLDTLIDDRSDPIDVWTTLDPNMQTAAAKAVDGDAPDAAQGALVSLDRDGAVRAMVGGRNFVTSNYNRATEAVRQPGSSFKLFVYLSALESGMKPTDTMVDQPVDINGWHPQNDNHTYSGPVSLREAFARSINTVSAEIGQQLGFSTVADMAHRFGITTPISTYPSMVLGTSEVRLIEMTQAFAAIENKGVAVSPYGIAKVVTADGRVLYDHQPPEQRVLVAPWVAAEMTDLLQSAVMSGTGTAAQIGRPVAGKTGTTQSNRDGWFIGFSSGLTTGVWMGRDDAKPVAGLWGGTAPAHAFHDYMSVAVANRPVEQFDTQVPMPDWQLAPDEEAPLDNSIDNGVAPPVYDENGNPIPQPPGQVQIPEPPPGPADPSQQPVSRRMPPPPGYPPPGYPPPGYPPRDNLAPLPPGYPRQPPYPPRSGYPPQPPQPRAYPPQ